MTSRATRSELSQALAKALAFRDCGQTAKAAAWAAELVRMLEAQAILTESARAGELWSAFTGRSGAQP